MSLCQYSSRPIAFFGTLCAAFAVALPLVAAEAGQAPAPPATSAKPQQTFRTDTKIIEVDASVFDKNGTPVTDLTAADFVIRENGAPQAIQAIYLVSGDPAIARATPTPGLAGAVEMPRRVELKQRVFVFVLDLTHLSAAGFTRSKRAIESFLKDAATPADILGIVVNGQMLNNRLDTDKAALLKALATVPGPNQSRFNSLREWPRLLGEGEATQIAHGDTTLLDEAVKRGCAEHAGECDSRAGDEPVRRQVESKARLTAAEAAHDAQGLLLALQALANGLGRFQGTKQVAVFSEGFYADELLDSIQKVVGIAARNGVRFSTLDARGLTSGPAGVDFLGVAPRPTSPGANVDTDADVLSSIALDTGGLFVQRFNDLRPSLDAIARESGTYYVLGYSPANPLDGSFRKIEVTVTRKDLTVRARRGYIASPAAAAPSGAAASTSSTATTSPPASAAATPPPVNAPPSSGGTTATGTNPVATTGGTSAAGAAANDAVTPLRMRPGSADRIAALVTREGADPSHDADRLASEGWDAYSKGDVEQARDKFAAAVKTGAEKDWVFYALGQSEFALGRHVAAGQAWEELRKRLPEYEPVYFDLADDYIVLDRTSDALTVLRAAVKLWPQHAEGYNALGVVLTRRGAIDDAIQAFQKATDVAPTEGLGFYNLGRAYQMRYMQAQRHAGAAGVPTNNAVGDKDRQHAIDAYTKYLQIGGAFEQQARDALAALNWR